MALSLLKRIIKGSALTHGEVDQNWDDIISAFNTLETRIGVSLEADGTLKPDVITGESRPLQSFRFAVLPVHQ